MSRLAAVGTIFNAFSYDAELGLDSNLPPSRQRADAERFKSQLRFLKRDPLMIN